MCDGPHKCYEDVCPLRKILANFEFAWITFEIYSIPFLGEMRLLGFEAVMFSQKPLKGFSRAFHFELRLIHW
jgi:hypothetical protein